MLQYVFMYNEHKISQKIEINWINHYMTHLTYSVCLYMFYGTFDNSKLNLPHLSKLEEWELSWLMYLWRLNTDTRSGSTAAVSLPEGSSSVLCSPSALLHWYYVHLIQVCSLSVDWYVCEGVCPRDFSSIDYSCSLWPAFWTSQDPSPCSLIN